MVFSINGIDFSGYLYRYGLTVQYEKIYGKGGDFTKDGHEVVNLIRIRPVITAACNPLTSQRLAKLANALKEEYVMVDFTDPVEERDVRLEMIPSLSPVNKSLVISGTVHWKDAVISLRER